MRKNLRNFLRSYISATLSEELRNGQNQNYNNNHNHSPNVDSIQPDEIYPASNYEPIFQISPYDLPNDQQDEGAIFSNHSDNISTQDMGDFFRQEEIISEELSAEQQEINNAINETINIIHDVSACAMDESNLFDSQSLEDTINPAEAEFLDEMLEDPMLRDDLMDNIDPFFFQPLI